LAGLLLAVTLSGQQWAAEQDHRNMLDQLGIKALRPGPSGNESAPNAANYDESKANPFPNLPEVLKLKNGQKATTAEMWWKQRRPEIIEDFEREVLGRVPGNVPKVTWAVSSTADVMVGYFPAISKQLVGHVDNSSYPMINVDIEMTVVTPAHAKGPVPVMMLLTYPRGALPVRPAIPGADPPTDRRWVGLCVHCSGEHPGGQRSRLNQRDHRSRQQGPAAQAGRLGRAAGLGLGLVARAGLSGDG
jgi:hypothetical protein